MLGFTALVRWPIACAAVEGTGSLAGSRSRFRRIRVGAPSAGIDIHIEIVEA
ncbi:MAG: hypothetical protein JXA90_15315 [Planctomycetes bacterium]|nr:hypothetical protein [Planctomycetota bacterium]